MSKAALANEPACDWLDREGLLQRERGLPIQDHLAGCERCRQRLAEYERLATTLTEAPEPPAHWETRVWARIAEREQAPRRRRAPVWVLAVAVAGAACLALIFLRPGPDGAGSAVMLAMHVERASNAPVLRGEGNSVVRVEASQVRARHVELRVYRDDNTLVARCTTEPPCVRAGELFTASVPAPAAGRYRAVLFTSESPLPPPAGSYELDDAAARAAGATPHATEAAEVW
jgi:hypothetical protein